MVGYMDSGVEKEPDRRGVTAPGSCMGGRIIWMDPGREGARDAVMDGGMGMLGGTGGERIELGVDMPLMGGGLP
jgi:hypothetical protein